MGGKQIITMAMENGAVCYHCAGHGAAQQRIAKGEQCIEISSSAIGFYFIALAHKDMWPEARDVVVP